jgi:hypothetical protein
VTRWRIAAIGGIVVLGGALTLVVLLRAIQRAPETYPLADNATTSIYALRAARGELAVGAYSRFHWNHPGPLLYELLAPLYALSGYREISIKWTALVLNVFSLGALLALVRRRAPALALAIPLALAPLLWREQRLLFSAWNPLAPVLPLTLAVGLAAAVAVGDVAWLPALVVVASFMVQSHIGYATVTAAIGGIAALTLAWRTASGRVRISRRTLGWSAGLSLAAAGILWAAPLYEQFRSPDGNLGAICRFFLAGTPQPRSWIDAFTLFANQLVGPLTPGWELTMGEASAAASAITIASTVAELAALSAAAVMLTRRRRMFEASFAWLCLAASAAGVAAARLVVGPVGDYLIFWISALGMLNLAVIASAWAGGRLADRPAVRAFTAAWLAAVVLATASVGAVRLQSKHASDARNTTVRSLASDIDGYCREHLIERPLLSFDWDAWQEATGILLQFYKSKRAIAVPDDMNYLVGLPFARTGGEAAEFYLMPRGAALPPGVSRTDWVAARGAHRILRVYR